MGDDRSFQAEREISRISAFFPILPRLGNLWAASRPWEGKTIAVNLHLTTLTAALLRELSLGGAELVVSAANSATTDAGAVQLLRNLGLEVYTGREPKERHHQVLEHRPDFLVDVGFQLVETLLENSELAAQVMGAVEVTRSGIDRMRNQESLPFPVVNINDGRLKDAVENRHGVGEAIWQAVARLTGMHLSGRRVAVVGYGPVGRGLASYGRAAGMNVEVVETDPVKRLFAHYDGFPTPKLANALTRVGVLVTATGKALAVNAADLAGARDNLVLLNAGTGGDEIDVAGIRRAAEHVEHIGDQVVRYRLENGTRATVLGNGHPLNIVLNSGSPEPVLLHFAVLGLTLEWMARGGLAPGEHLVTDDIENRAAVLALQALNLSGS
jgi:adenosylhomocysteinase